MQHFYLIFACGVLRKHLSVVPQELQPLPELLVLAVGEAVVDHQAEQVEVRIFVLPVVSARALQILLPLLVEKGHDALGGEHELDELLRERVGLYLLPEVQSVSVNGSIVLFGWFKWELINYTFEHF